MCALKTEQRKFNLPDAEMIQASRVYLRLFINDKDFFTSFDGDFNDPFADEWLAAIDAADDVAKDNLLKDSLAVKTAAVKKAAEDCRQLYSRLKYFIEKAFADKSAVWQEFGYYDYNKIRKLPVKLEQFMLLLRAVTLKYQPQLTGAGCPAEDIQSVEDLYLELQSANRGQRLFKKERVLLTAERVAILNRCWYYSLKVNRASKTVFANNPAMRESYVVTNSTAGNKKAAV